MRLVLLLAVLEASAEAATFTVGPGQPYTTINAAIIDAQDGDRIEVLAGTYAENLVIIEDLEIVGIDGAATTVLAGPSTLAPGVAITGAEVLLQGFTLDNGLATRGLDIEQSSGELEDLVIKNYANGEPGSGARILSSKLSITDCTFAKNGTAGQSGGHLFARQSDLVISDGVFEEGLASRGGAIAAEDSTLVTISTAFFLNGGEGTFGNDGSGGALHLTGSSLTDTGSRFDSNYTDDSGHGGAITLDGADASFTNSRFEGNESGRSGGAVWINGGDLVLSAVFAEGNLSGWSGGVAYLDEATLTVEAGEYLENIAEGSQFGGTFSGSGGVFWLDRTTASIEGALLELNSANNVGGAFVSFDSTLNATDASCVGNIAEYGGCGYLSNGAHLTASRTSFTGNSATESGGVFRWRNSNQDGTVTVTDSDFSANAAGAFGGGIAANAGGRLVLTDNTWSANDADNGGAISLFEVEEAQVVRQFFCGNHSDSDGGAVRLSAVGSVRNDWVANVFVENSAGLEGGGLISMDSTLAFWNNTVVGNTAAGGGGAFLDDTTGTLSNSLFAWNSQDGISANSTQNLSGDYNAFWQNTPADLSGALANASLPESVFDDPQLSAYSQNGNCDDDHLWLLSSSPLIDAGDPGVFDADGTPSDIGAYGGPEGLEAGSDDADNDGFDTPFDCDDTDPLVNPGATEVCDGRDNDCDGIIDGPGAEGAVTVHLDADGDGYGDPTQTAEGCPDVDGVIDGGDCDDGNASINPAAEEVCDGLDNDCDGTVDEVVNPPTWWDDADGDGFGDPNQPTTACFGPPGSVQNDADCDDADDSVFPGADEFCNGLDDDCDTLVDEDAVDAEVWYQDADGDGYGAVVAEISCVPPEDSTSEAGDCDDGDADFYPGAPEDCDSGMDFNCDGSVGDVDGDGDGFSACEECDDSDDTVNPDAEEIWYDGVDQDCDGASDYDQDGDGFETLEHRGTDCDDLDPDVNPDADDAPDDGVDSDCDGQDGRVLADPFADEELTVGRCGCSGAGTGGAGWLVLLAMLGVRRRSG